MLDLSNESPLSISEAARILPTRPHASTLWRWMQKGIRGIRLEYTIVGGRRFTSHEALERFEAAINAAAGHPAVTPSLSARREQEIEAAERELDEAGVK